MKKIIEASIDQALQATLFLKREEVLLGIRRIAEGIVETYRRGGKVIVAGNGGSLCDACHFVEELVGFYREKRKPLAAMALAEPSYITCVANDLSFDKIFSRGLEAYGKPEDFFIALTTSGNSPNILEALQEAKNQGIRSACLLGKGGGKAKGMADIEIIIEGFSTSDRIQEAHMIILHILVDLVEKSLFAPSTLYVVPQAATAEAAAALQL